MDEIDDEVRDVYVGRVLDGRYRLLARLGAGGMGAVYEAEHAQIGRRVAIKILHPQFAGDAEIVRRFRNEARASGTLGHPNIAQAVDFGRTDEGAPWMAIELLDGRDLAQTVAEEGPLAFARAVGIADQIADALGAAHAAGIVHRDIKPENVFVCAGDVVKVLDFGISKFSTGDSSVATRTGAFMGSAHYMAPEQIADASRADARTDVYSLGAVLHTMLSGTTVFPDASLPMLVVAITNDEPRPLVELRQDTPPELAALVTRMLQKSPDERPRSMREVRDALSALGPLDAAGGPDGPRPRDESAMSFEPTQLADSVAEVPLRSLPMAWIVGGLAVVAAIAGLAIYGAADPEHAEVDDVAATSAAEPPAPEPIPAGRELPDEPLDEVTAIDGGPSVVAAPPEPPAPEPSAPEPPAPEPSAPEPPPSRTERRIERQPERRTERRTDPVEQRREPASETPPPPPSTTRIDGVPIDDVY